MSFHCLLQAQLERRRAANRNYSVRAFARSLATDHATLSQWLRGKRRLSNRSIRMLGRRLGLGAQEIDEHCAIANEEAILAALGHAKFRADSRWLAQLLNVPIDEINVALQRLLRQRRITMISSNRWLAENARGE